MSSEQLSVQGLWAEELDLTDSEQPPGAGHQQGDVTTACVFFDTLI